MELSPFDFILPLSALSFPYLDLLPVALGRRLST